ncbi:MAG: A24 family peptidase [bacterium]
MLVSQILLIAVLIIAVVTDVRYGKIKNWLTLPAIAIGPLVHYAEGGSSYALSSLEAIGVMLLASLVLKTFGPFGWGDTKLLMAVGSLGGMALVRDSLLCTALAGGLLSIFYLMHRRMAGDMAKRIANFIWLKMIFGAGSLDGVRTGIKMPYSIAIAVGTVVAVFLPR